MVLLGLVLVATGLVGMTRLPLLQRRLPLDENALHPGAAAPPAPLTGLALWPTSPAAWLAALQHRTGVHGQVLDGGDAAFITVRAPRAAGGANIVLHACPDGHSAQLLAAMAAALSQAPFLARDIVFLLSPQAATLARLPSVSGTLAAISLNITRTSMHHLELSIVGGSSGRLPNMDVVEAAARVAEKLGVALDLVFDVWALAGFAPPAPHAELLDQGIEAFTLQSSETDGSLTAERDAWRVLAGVLRSLNNLEEHLHQNHWYYLITGARHFVPLSVYMVPGAALWAAYVVTGAQHLLRLRAQKAPPWDCVPALAMHVALAATAALAASSMALHDQRVQAGLTAAAGWVSCAWSRWRLAPDRRPAWCALLMFAVGLHLSVRLATNMPRAVVEAALAAPLLLLAT